MERINEDSPKSAGLGWRKHIWDTIREVNCDVSGSSSTSSPLPQEKEEAETHKKCKGNFNFGLFEEALNHLEDKDEPNQQDAPLDFEKLFQIDKDTQTARRHLRQIHTHTFNEGDIGFSGTYDAASDFYAVAVRGRNLVSLFNTNDEGLFAGVNLISSTSYPGLLPLEAVAIVSPGIRYAVIAGDEIIGCSYEAAWVYNLIFDGKKNNITKLRGLTADTRREVLFTYESGAKKIHCINAKKSARDELLFSCTYGRPLFHLNHSLGMLQFGNVSFLHYHRGTLAVSDLGTYKHTGHVNQCMVRSYQVDYNAKKLVLRHEYFNEDVFKPNTPGYIAYGSGIMIDDKGWVIVGDARGSSLHVFNERLQPICIINTFGEPGAKPYIAGIALSPKSVLLVSPRRGKPQVMIYKYEEDNIKRQYQYAERTNFVQRGTWNGPQRGNWNGTRHGTGSARGGGPRGRFGQY
ncbi:unnamed protein product, partial [Mesorhabditis belari]|uniref:Uncharacterized protein n=1 Tax=Mesorhabditis belari TaxID=2138241 RepID=A0AAF3J6C9_9BILA